MVPHVLVVLWQVVDEAEDGDGLGLGKGLVVSLELLAELLQGCIRGGGAKKDFFQTARQPYSSLWQLQWQLQQPAKQQQQLAVEQGPLNRFSAEQENQRFRKQQ